MKSIDDLDLQLLKEIQDGIQVTLRPYKAVAEQLGISEDEVISRLQMLKDEGIIRRFAATIGHRVLGIVANAMIVWKVPPDSIEKVGRIMASFEQVTHCYERPTTPEWPYNLYTVVHSQEREECANIAAEISRAAGIDDYQILFSEREFKKTGARL
jgi:DNA-binding Lrp family transcriptional regulator